MKTKEPTVQGEILEALSGGRYSVDIDGVVSVCYASGKMKFNHIRIGIGDRVEVILDPFGGHATNRIVRRL